jgi:hypothetical protein
MGKSKSNMELVELEGCPFDIAGEARLQGQVKYCHEAGPQGQIKYCREVQKRCVGGRKIDYNCKAKKNEYCGEVQIVV